MTVDDFKITLKRLNFENFFKIIGGYVITLRQLCGAVICLIRQLRVDVRCMWIEILEMFGKWLYDDCERTMIWYDNDLSLRWLVKVLRLHMFEKLLTLSKCVIKKVSEWVRMMKVLVFLYTNY